MVTLHPDKRTVKRGEVVKGKVSFQSQELGRARAVRVELVNVLEYPNPCSKNLSKWKYTKKLSKQELKRYGYRVPFEFALDKKAPITYKGKKLKSYWELQAIIDIPLWFDKAEKAKLEVMR